MSTGLIIERIKKSDGETFTDGALAASLHEIIADCVEGGASVGFMLPMTLEKSKRFWAGVIENVQAGHRELLLARSGAGELLGTVQLVLNLPENQPHRAEVAKMLVKQRARRQGVARSLLGHVDMVAREHGRSLLVLDTISGSPAQYLYESEGWQICGRIPKYALMPDGKMESTTFMYKLLQQTP